MQEHREKTRKVVEQVIEAESNFLYTTDTDYLTKRGAFVQVNYQYDFFYLKKNSLQILKTKIESWMLIESSLMNLDTELTLISIWSVEMSEIAFQNSLLHSWSVLVKMILNSLYTMQKINTTNSCHS